MHAPLALHFEFVHRIGFSSTAFQPHATAAEITAYSNFSVPLSSTLLPRRLKDAGYSTYGFGKWNIGHCNESYLPTARGFDEVRSFSRACERTQTSL